MIFNQAFIVLHIGSRNQKMTYTLINLISSCLYEFIPINMTQTAHSCNESNMYIVVSFHFTFVDLARSENCYMNNSGPEEQQNVKESMSTKAHLLGIMWLKH